MDPVHPQQREALRHLLINLMFIDSLEKEDIGAASRREMSKLAERLWVLEDDERQLMKAGIVQDKIGHSPELVKVYLKGLGTTGKGMWIIKALLQADVKHTHG